jgi:hypothetical protein
VTVEPATSADLRLRHRFNVSVDIPVRYELIGIPRWCTLSVRGLGFEQDVLVLKEYRNESCALGARVLAHGGLRFNGLDLVGCHELLAITGTSEIRNLLIGRLALQLASVMETAVGGYTAECPIQP